MCFHGLCWIEGNWGEPSPRKTAELQAVMSREEPTELMAALPKLITSVFLMDVHLPGILTTARIQAERQTEPRAELSLLLKSFPLQDPEGRGPSYPQVVYEMALKENSTGVPAFQTSTTGFPLAE